MNHPGFLAQRIRVGIDTGGTFTDFVVHEPATDVPLRYAKVLSTPDDPARAIVEGLKQLGLADQPIDVVHGSTVGTNAVLEGKGARVAFVTSNGFSDVLTLGRQQREHVYRLEQPDVAPPVPPELCFEVSTRPDASGGLLAEADEAELDRLADRIASSDAEAVAVSLLFSWLQPEQERRIREHLPSGLYVSLSHEVLPREGEYERSVATWMNASVGPVMARYLRNLQQALPAARIAVMQSDGLSVSAARASDRAVRLLLSGPAGGLAAVHALGQACGEERLLSFDMGGTSTDVAWLDGDIPLSSETQVGPWPVPVAAVDMATIGAGGGSIARVDSGGLLLVGPQSSGASPGPACYGQGGAQATVTDAHVVLGRIPPGSKLGGDLPLDAGAAERVIGELASAMGLTLRDAALGVVRVANEHMAQALRVISVERGHDPRSGALACFGGAGGLHACELAEQLGMTRIFVPPAAGVLSALGMLVSRPGRECAVSWGTPLSAAQPAEMQRRFAAMEAPAIEELLSEGVPKQDVEAQRLVELRYAGQSATIPVDIDADNLAEAFHQSHEQRYGHRLESDIELAGLRSRLRGRAQPLSADSGKADTKPGQHVEPVMLETGSPVPVVPRPGASTDSAVHGPAIIAEPLATIWVAPGWVATAGEAGNLLMERIEN